MSSTRRILIYFAVIALSAQAATSQIMKKGSRGRVAGLAVSILDQIPNGAGKDVDIQVEMTTVRTEFLPRPTTTRGGPGGVLEAFTDSEISSRRYGFGGLGDADLRATISASDTEGRSFSNFFYQPQMSPRAFSSFYYGEALEFTFRQSEFKEGEQPALDYGDGMTVDVETLQPFGSPITSTTGPRRFIRSRWRGTFTHTYADLGSYTVTAASRCCPIEQNLSDDDDTIQRLGPFYTASPGYVVYANSPSQLQFAYANYERLKFQSAYTSPTTFGTIRGPGSPQTGTFVQSFSSEGTGVRFGAQVTNTALIEDGLGTAFAIEIPTAGAYGLGLLSLLLAAGGVLVLRR